MNVNSERNTPAHVAKELDRLGVSDEGIVMNAVEAQAQVREHRLERASREWLVDRLEQVEAERDRLWEWIAGSRGETREQILASVALHPKERDDG